MLPSEVTCPDLHWLASPPYRRLLIHDIRLRSWYFRVTADRRRESDSGFRRTGDDFTSTPLFSQAGEVTRDDWIAPALLVKADGSWKSDTSDRTPSRQRSLSSSH